MRPRERVEVFQLLFLRSLFAQLEDRALVILKGGVNLRFYSGSPRFSEDIDFDVRTMARRTLAGTVERLLAPRSALTRVLAASGLHIEDWSAPKQTDEVQRWKVALREGTAVPEPTKIEFSRRGAGKGVSEPVPSHVLERHGLAGPIVATHYGIDDAAAQKVRALLGRAVPQARDVFDLHLLLGRGATLPRLSRKDRSEARDRVLAFDEADFAAHVVAFLEPDERGAYASFEAITALQLRVASALESAP